MTEKELVDNHILYEQNLVIEELFRLGKVSEKWLCEELEEVLEWWLVTPFLAELLKDRAEFVLEEFGCYWWGRTCSGQTISMNGIISEIVQSL